MWSLNLNRGECMTTIKTEVTFLVGFFLLSSAFSANAALLNGDFSNSNHNGFYYWSGELLTNLRTDNRANPNSIGLDSGNLGGGGYAANYSASTPSVTLTTSTTPSPNSSLKDDPNYNTDNWQVKLFQVFNVDPLVDPADP